MIQLSIVDSLMIDNSLLLRMLEIREFFTEQWLSMSLVDGRKASAELSSLRRKREQLLELAQGHEEDVSGGRGGTARGLRGKNDRNRRRTVRR